MIFTYYDSHVHSLNSSDATPSVTALCETALSKGLAGIAVTDHVDVGRGAAHCLSVIARMKSDVERARETYGDRLEISLGMELGEAHHDAPLARELASDGAMDFVIGSLHRPRKSDDYYHVDYDRADMDKMFGVYYDELAEMVDAGCFDVIGHINYQLRYMSAAARSKTDARRYRGRVREILRETARKGKGIEINTSGFWKGLGFSVPSPDVVKMFREEGGEIVTTGSDAHRLENVGEGIGSALKILASAGFGRFAFFRKRAPEFHDV